MTQQLLSRRQVLILAAGLASVVQGRAQAAWPSRPMRLIVPAGAGTGTDVMARLIADQLARQLGQPFVVENAPGAAGIVGTEKALRAAPDGYTFLFGYNQLMSINPHLYAKLPYDPVRGAAPISLTGKGGYALIASPKVPFNTFEAFVEYARTHPGQLVYASSGNGSVAHLGMELIKQKAGIDLLHVPYRTSSDVTNDLLSGRVHVRLEIVNATIPLANTGRIKTLAVSTASRARMLPDVPTLMEKLPGFGELVGWNAIWTQPGVPVQIIERMAKEIAVAMRDPKVTQRVIELGGEVYTCSPAEMAQLIEQDSQVWGKLIKEKGIKVD